MAEYTANALQTIEAGQNVLFSESPFCCKKGYVSHRDGSGVFRLKGLTQQCKARYKVSFGANIGLPTGATVEEISIAIAIESEPQLSATAISTPAAVEDLNNIFTAVYVEVDRGCCLTISVENSSTQAILVQNANLIIERVA